MKRAYYALIAATALAAQSGCSKDERVEFIELSSPQPNESVTAEQIRIPEGIAVSVVARPTEDGDPMDNKTTVDLSARSSGVLGVSPGSIQSPDVDPPGPEAWRYVLFGIKAGSTSLVVRINDDDAGEIPVTVDPQ